MEAIFGLQKFPIITGYQGSFIHKETSNHRELCRKVRKEWQVSHQEECEKEKLVLWLEPKYVLEWHIFYMICVSKDIQITQLDLNQC